MLSSLSIMLMIFVDRWYLAQYSTRALNATVNSSTLGWAFVCGWLMLGQISEVFVSQHNGANEKDKLGLFVWQNLWLGVMSFAFFIPLIVWGVDWFYPGANQTYEREYLNVILMFGPVYCFYGALSGFFIGQGKAMIVTTFAVGANLINIVLDRIFIFGVEGWVPSMGVQGAALATNIGTVFESIGLFVLFLSKDNRTQCRTNDYSFRLPYLIRILKVGLPRAIFVSLEMFGFAAYYQLMSGAGEVYITVAGICQSMVILFSFIIEGMGNAAIAIAGNYIGAKKFWAIRRLVASGLKFLFGFLLVFLAVFIFGKEIFINQFLPDVSPGYLMAIHDTLTFCLFIMVFYTFFRGVQLLFAGVLTAAGDTFFLFAIGTLSVWGLYVLPTYLVLFWLKGSVEAATFVNLGFICCFGMITMLRYFQGGWQLITIRDTGKFGKETS